MLFKLKSRNRYENRFNVPDSETAGTSRHPAAVHEASHARKCPLPRARVLGAQISKINRAI